MPQISRRDCAERRWRRAQRGPGECQPKVPPDTLPIGCGTSQSPSDKAKGDAMSRSLSMIAAAIALTALAMPALANDSTASTGAGGLVLRQTADIDMLSEDLYVSVEQIRVHYVFR